MQSTIISAVFACMVASSMASPVLKRDMCNTTPTASTSANVQAIATPSVTTAELCQQQCDANSACQSFVFGLASGASTPTCSLFSVPASQVPSQGTNIMVFDKACTSVPTTVPTASNPVGASTSSGSTGTTTSTTGGSNTGGQSGQQNKRDVCGAAPTGPSTSQATPLQTATNIATQADCLALCKTNSECKSVEFGKTSANGADQCLLFSVDAASLPAPTNGQSLVAFDTGC